MQMQMRTKQPAISSFLSASTLASCSFSFSNAMNFVNSSSSTAKDFVCQYLYFSTSKASKLRKNVVNSSRSQARRWRDAARSVSICTLAPVNLQYLYSSTSKASKLSTCNNDVEENDAGYENVAHHKGDDINIGVIPILKEIARDARPIVTCRD
jgi:hypothetical protein